jgi:hypothetical protein
MGKNIEQDFREWMTTNGREGHHARQKVRDSYTVSEYRSSWENNMLTPDSVDNYFQAFWRRKGEQIGLSQQLAIPACDRSVEELAALRREERGVILMPDEIMGDKGSALLGKMFPVLQTWSTDRNAAAFFDTSGKGGCIDIEMDLYSRHKDVTEPQARELFSSQRKQIQRLQTYIVGSNISKELIGHYFDEEGSSRIALDYPRDATIDAAFSSDGQLIIIANLDPNLSGLIGARSEGRKNIQD